MRNSKNWVCLDWQTGRTIYMGTGAAVEEPSASPLGTSHGRWDGSTLAVTTTAVNWPHFDTVGIPLSEAVRIVEIFTPSAAGDRLDYEMTVTDPATFTEPVTIGKHWVWVPGVEIGNYNCVVDG